MSALPRLLAATLAAATLVAVATPASAARLPGVVWPPPEPERYDPVFQITEIVANSPNHDGTDAFEYVEVLNVSDGPLAWDDFRIRYIYPIADLNPVSTVEWPTTTTGAIVQPGETLVLWIRSEATAGLTAADFNSAYGSDLVEGETLAMVDGGGLSNSVLRGIEVLTDAGIQLSRAYYNRPGDADAEVKGGVHYGVVADADEIQPRLTVAAASPGDTSAQGDWSAIATAPPGREPRLRDETRSQFSPGMPLNIEAWANDDGLLHSVNVEVETDLDEPRTVALTRDAIGKFVMHLGGADTVGRAWVRYRFVVKAGDHVLEGPQTTVTAAGEPAALRIGGGHRGEPLGADLVVPTVQVPLTRGTGAYVSGEQRLVVGGDAYPPTHTLLMDGVEVPGEPELEHEPLLAFEATLTDPYFRNGVIVDGDVLTVFDEGFLGDTETVEVALPLDEVNPGEPVVARIYSGTKAAPAIDPNEVNDDFVARNVRLGLPDGRMLRPREITDPERWIDIGDNAGSIDYLEVTFDVPDDAFTALGYTWDTTTATDGRHTFEARDGSQTASLELRADNTAPALVPSIGAGAEVRGDVTLDVDAQDAGSGVAEVTATLDGRSVRLPHALSSLTDDPGDHVAQMVATDREGNTATTTVPFTIPRERPVLTSASASGASAGQATVLTATLDDASGDLLDVAFAEGRRLDLGTDVTVASGTVADAATTDRADATPVSPGDLRLLAAADGDAVVTTADSGLPYVVLEADVPPGAEQVRVVWSGGAEADARLTLSAHDPREDRWVEVDSLVTREDDGTVELEAVVDAGLADADGTLTAVVQHGIGWAGPDLTTRASAVDQHHPDDTERADYDFTLAWESDTQYYNAQPEIYDRQTSIHDYLLARRDELNLKYLIHTGDVVDWSGQPEQWLRADPAYAELDEAGLPYGLLAGNHDVNQTTNDYTQFSQWFGAERYEQNPWWGGDHLDNRGHYDLLSAGGIDFLFVYMGWGAENEQIDWMNEVLAAYPERLAFVNLHEYMLTTGGLGPLPQRIHDEVVAINPNVRFVLSGHYHDAYTRLDSFDDDGDGSDDRTVTSMLFDYQDLPHGGDGYLRLLHFDNESQQIQVRTYSDYQYDYDAVHKALDDEHQEFTIPYAQAGIVAEQACLRTDAVRVDALMGDTIASYTDVPAGEAVSASWEPTSPGVGWFVTATDPYGGTVVTDVLESRAPAAYLTALGAVAPTIAPRLSGFAS
ncbi:metallophosphoesterase [Demequina sp. NBRC 110055]|uniref:metallophosphoesterase n=1 Tax=Demequina sp. NBRC 110055 TaxID=1570344 RepID=UPI000A047086|nr:metallophosphoesterase [Demequina sp. NBRC 110055]